MKVSLTFQAHGRSFAAEAEYYAGHPGSMYRRNGDPGDPPEPAEVEIYALSETLESGIVIDALPLLAGPDEELAAAIDDAAYTAAAEMGADDGGYEPEYDPYDKELRDDKDRPGDFD